MWYFGLVIFVGLRTILPVLLFLNPLWVAVLYIFVLDDFDVYFAAKAGWTKRHYFICDKLLDYWWYLFILIFGLGTPLAGVFVVLFIYRSVGQIWALHKEEVLLFFPGIIELYFLGYLILVRFWPQALANTTGQTVLLVIATVLALIREYIIHIKKIDVSKKLIGIGQVWKK